MSDKVNVEEIIGIVKTDEVTNSVEEVRKLRGRGERMSEEKKILLPQVGDIRFTEERGWETYLNKNGVEWCPIPMIDVPVERLLMKWEDLVMELSDKEVELYNLKEAYLIAEADIVNNTNFKELYGANNQKVRDNHVRNELSDMVSEMKTLEFGINWIRSYIPLLREVVRCKE